MGNARRTLRVLANAAPNGSGRPAERLSEQQRRQLMAQTLRTPPALSSAGQDPASEAADAPPRHSALHRLLLSGAAAIALLTAAATPRPAEAFQWPGNMFGGTPPAAAAMPTAPAPPREAVPATMENKTPLPNLSELSTEEIKTVTLFRDNTPCVVSTHWSLALAGSR
jgi:hypothetical protein